MRRLNGVKRLVAMLTIFVLVFQYMAVHALAADVSLVGYSQNEATVLINIFSEGNTQSDFVIKAPKKLWVNKETRAFPVEEWETVQRWQYNDIPRYFQSSYPNALYGEGTVETCGSSITALAMVATYLTGYDYLPDELARWFAGTKDEDVARLTYGAKALSIPVVTTEDWLTVCDALKAGKVVIIQLDRTSIFVDSDEMNAQHFVVLTGVTKDNKILVQDPCVAHYIEETLQEGFQNGFEETDVGTGFRYAWIFDKTAVPQNIERYKEIVKPATQKRYTTLKLTPAEKQLLARVLYVNAGGECLEGQQVFLEVILNRLLSKNFPDSLREVLKSEEFVYDAQSLSEVQLSSLQYDMVDRAINGPYILTTKDTEFSYQCHK